MWLYNYNGVIYSNEKVDSEGNRIPADEIINDHEIWDTDEYGFLDAIEHSFFREHCSIAEYKGKLGIMTRCEDPHSHESEDIFRCPIADFKYDSIKVLDKGPEYGQTYVIGTADGVYHCMQICENVIIDEESEYCCDVIEEGNTVHELKITDKYEECLEGTIKCSFNELRITDLKVILSISSSNISSLAPGQVFVFGANREGQHLGGAAQIAHKKFGAEMGVGDGPAGNSYAITTMDGTLALLKTEIDKFILYAERHPDKEFLLTRVACGAAGWTDDDVAPLFHGILELGNVMIPLRWAEVVSCDCNLFDETMKRLLPSCGRGSLDEWIGRLAVLYAIRKQVPLIFKNNGIELGTDSHPDEICESLVLMANAQNLSEGTLRDLYVLQSTARDISYIDYNQWFEHTLLTDLLSGECVELAEGTLINPGIKLVNIVNKLMSDAGCTRVYNPYAGLCTLEDYTEIDEYIDYVFQEPSPILSLIARIMGKDCCTGDFLSSWAGYGCDGLACILPFEYSSKHSSGDSAIRSGAIRMTKHLLHRLTQPGTMKAAAVVVNRDVLTSRKYLSYRRVFLEQGYLERIIQLNDSCLSNNYENHVLMFFDFTKNHDNVRIAAPRYIDMLGDVGCYSDEVTWIDALDWITDFEKLVPKDYVEENDFCLSYDVYNVPVYRYFPSERYDGCIDFSIHSPNRQRFSSHDFDLIRVSDLLKEAAPVDNDSIGSNVIRVYSGEFSFDRRIIVRGLIRTENTPPDLPDKVYAGPCLAVSEWGLFYSKGENPFSPMGHVKVFKIDETKIDPFYLIGLLTYGVNLKAVIPYFDCWRVPIIKGGLDEQRNFVKEKFPELLDSINKYRKYNALLFGNIDASVLTGASLEVIPGLTAYKKNEVAVVIEKFKRSADVIIVDSSFGLNEKGQYRGLSRVMSIHEDIPVYVIKRNDVDIVLDDDDYEEYLNNRVFSPCSSMEMIKAILAEINQKNSPEYIVRKEYEKEFSAANDVQKAIKFDKIDIAKEMESILVGCRNQNPSIAERSFNFFRNVRDGIFRALRNRQALPDLDMGALASLLADKYYSDGKDDSRKYYMTGRLMPNNLAAGLQYLSFISNEAVHTGNGDKDAALAAVHILFQLLFWTQDKIGEGFFDRSHANEFYTDESGLDWEYKLEEEYPVMCARRARGTTCSAQMGTARSGQIGTGYSAQ